MVRNENLQVTKSSFFWCLTSTSSNMANKPPSAFFYLTTISISSRASQITENSNIKCRITLMAFQWRRTKGRLNTNTVFNRYGETVLSLTWESPYLEKTVFILRRGPGATIGDRMDIVTSISRANIGRKFGLVVLPVCCPVPYSTPGIGGSKAIWPNIPTAWCCSETNM